MFALSASDIIKVFDMLRQSLVGVVGFRRKVSADQQRRSASIAGHIADSLEGKADQFRNGLGFVSISIPSEMRFYAKSDLLSSLGDAPHLSEVLQRAADAVAALEASDPYTFQSLSRDEQDQMLLAIYEAAGQFRAIQRLLA